METLFEKLLGTWTLVELIEVPVNGGEITHPMGENPKGLIIYNPDGYMSAQIMDTHRENFHQEHWTMPRRKNIHRKAQPILRIRGRSKRTMKNNG